MAILLVITPLFRAAFSKGVIMSSLRRIVINYQGLFQISLANVILRFTYRVQQKSFLRLCDLPLLAGAKLCNQVKALLWGFTQYLGKSALLRELSVAHLRHMFLLSVGLISRNQAAHFTSFNWILYW